MLRSLLIVAATLLAVVLTVSAVVGVAIHRLHNAHQAADADFHPSPTIQLVTAATQPTADPDPPPFPQSHSIELWAADGIPHGHVQLGSAGAPAHRSSDTPLKSEKAESKRRERELMGGHPITTFLTDFRTPSDYVEWNVTLPKASSYDIAVSYSCAKSQSIGEFVVEIHDQKVSAQLQPSRGFRVTSLGTLTLPAGTTTLTFRRAPSDAPHVYLNLRCIQIIPAS